MKYFIVIFALIMTLVPVCLFFFVKRILSALGVDGKKKSTVALAAGIALVLSFAVMAAGGFGAIVILHVAVFELLLRLLCYIVGKAVKKRCSDGPSLWNKLKELMVIPLVLTAILMTYGFVNMNNIKETRYTVYTDKNIRDEGYRVVLVADVHFGVSLDGDELREQCARISKADADIVVLNGDIVDDSTDASEMREVFEAFGDIESGYGVFFTYGNHDRPMRPDSSSFDTDELEAEIEKNGITILEDDVINVTDEFVLVGRADKSAEHREGRLSIAELLSRADLEDYILTLDHQPNEYKENGEAGTDLLLSGHTHGGQLFPVNLLMEIIPFNDGVYGEYMIDSDTTAIVSSGFASWSYPVKTAAPSEYVVIDIKSKK